MILVIAPCIFFVDEDFNEFFILIVQNGAACLGDVALRIDIFSHSFHNFLETSVLELLLIRCLGISGTLGVVLDYGDLVCITFDGAASFTGLIWHLLLWIRKRFRGVYVGYF